MGQAAVIDANTLYESHRHHVFRYLARMLGAEEPARDLTQEVFLRVTRSGVPASDAVGRRAWVFRIARNLALNHLRDHRRRPQVPATADVAAPATQELRLVLDRALGTLTETDRDVFVLRETVGLSYDEIAQACDLTREGVRARLHRSRQSLRAILTDELAVHRMHGVCFQRTDSEES